LQYFFFFFVTGGDPYRKSVLRAVAITNINLNFFEFYLFQIGMNAPKVI